MWSHSFCFESFYHTWLSLDEKVQMGKVNEYTFPWIVNGAFASEIGLKYILAHNKIECPKIHLLHDLLSLLPSEHNEAIRQYMRDKNYNDEAINLQIMLVSNSFEEFRYAYEKALVIDMYFVKCFFTAIFKEVFKYPRYTVRDLGIVCNPDEQAQVDSKMLNVANEIVIRTSNKSKQKKNRPSKEVK